MQTDEQKREACGACKHVAQREPGNDDGCCYMFREAPELTPCAQYDDRHGSPVALMMREARLRGGRVLAAALGVKR